MFTAADIQALLDNATPDTIVHIDYVAGGGPVTDRAKKEFKQASDWNKAPTQYIGNFAGLKRNKFKELVLTLFVHNRGKTGAYRAFNPNLGEIRSVRIIHPS